MEGRAGRWESAKAKVCVLVCTTDHRPGGELAIVSVLQLLVPGREKRSDTGRVQRAGCSNAAPLETTQREPRAPAPIGSDAQNGALTRDRSFPVERLVLLAECSCFCTQNPVSRRPARLVLGAGRAKWNS
jgi:hypothetical protein